MALVKGMLQNWLTGREQKEAATSSEMTENWDHLSVLQVGGHRGGIRLDTEREHCQDLIKQRRENKKSRKIVTHVRKQACRIHHKNIAYLESKMDKIYKILCLIIVIRVAYIFHELHLTRQSPLDPFPV